MDFTSTPFMNRFLSLSFVGCLLFLVTQAQPPIPAETSLFTPYNPAVWNAPATQRVADVGKLWGTLKYFHPQLMKGTLQADELLLKTLDPLLDNPSKANFVRTIQGMLRLISRSDRARLPQPDTPVSDTISTIVESSVAYEPSDIR